MGGGGYPGLGKTQKGGRRSTQIWPNMKVACGSIVGKHSKNKMQRVYRFNVDSTFHLHSNNDTGSSVCGIVP